MQTRPLDPSDDDEVRRFHEIGWRAEMEDGRPWNAHWTFDEIASMLREPTPDDQAARSPRTTGRPSSAPAGEHSLVDNTDKAYVFPMVDPPARRSGAGGALVEALVDHCRGSAARR